MNGIRDDETAVSPESPVPAGTRETPDAPGDEAVTPRAAGAPVRTAVNPDIDTWPDAPTARWWTALDDGRLQCDLCPRRCRLHPGQRGFCFVRSRDGDRMVLTTYGRSSGFAIDPVEKKPLAHFYPGTAVLSFGTAGCNLNCRFCQNWDISKSREWDRLAAVASPDDIAGAAESAGCESVAFTYNDPVIFAEYAIDTAVASAVGLSTITTSSPLRFFGAGSSARGPLHAGSFARSRAKVASKPSGNPPAMPTVTRSLQKTFARCACTSASRALICCAVSGSVRGVSKP